MYRCEFCQELQLGHCPSLGSPPTGRWIFETANFVVLPTIGALVAGWLLIVSKKHYRAAAVLPIEQLEELEILMSEVEAYLTVFFRQPVVFFEHGPGERNSGGACIDHVHIHAVPASIDFTNELKSYLPTVLNRMTDLNALAQTGKPYLFYQSVEGVRHQIVLDTETPSQFFRQIVAQQLGLADKWDWAVFPELPNVQTAIDCACPYCVELRHRHFLFDEQDYGDRVVAESDKFAVLPTRGCIVPGYLLVVTKQHLPLAWQSYALRQEMDAVVASTSRILTNQYGINPVVFEHGWGTRTVHHAHLHVVPIEYYGPPRLPAPHDVIPIDHFAEADRFGNDRNRVVWQDSAGKRFVVILRRPTQRQVLRQVVAETAGRPEAWDWQRYPFTGNLLHTRDDLANSTL